MARTPHPTAPRIAVVGIVLSFALAVAVGILRTVNAEPVERAAEVAGNVAFAMVFAAPALLALLGLRGRPPLLVAAGALDLVLAFVSLFSFIGLVFVPPAVMFFVAAARMRRGAASSSAVTVRLSCSLPSSSTSSAAAKPRSAYSSTSTWR